MTPIYDALNSVIHFSDTQNKSVMGMIVFDIFSTVVGGQPGQCQAFIYNIC